MSILRVTPKVNSLLHLKSFFNPVHKSLAPALLILIFAINNLVPSNKLSFFTTLFSHLKLLCLY